MELIMSSSLVELSPPLSGAAFSAFGSMPANIGGLNLTSDSGGLTAIAAAFIFTLSVMSGWRRGCLMSRLLLFDVYALLIERSRYMPPTPNEAFK